MRLWLLLAVLFAGLGAKWVDPVVKDAKFSYVRDAGDSTKLPRLKGENSAGAAVTCAVRTSLVDRAGKTVLTVDSVIEIPAKGTVEIDPLGGKRDRVSGDILLLKSEINHPERGNTAVSGIFGTPEPVKPDKVDVFGMNVHLGRFPADVQWELIRMMKAAGVTTVRVDSSFRRPDDVSGTDYTFASLEQTILALEAFGMEPMILIGYFPPGFHQSPAKQQMAFDWAKMLAARFKGRASYHYGNETNSGWAGFGAAADMAALNNAFALGTAAGDAKALRGSFGIAEGLPNYVEAFLNAGTLPYLEAIAIHPYCGTPEAGIAKSLATKQLIRVRGGNQQVWATEVGFHFDDNGVFNEHTGELTGVGGFTSEHQKNLLPRLFILAQSAGIDRIYWYDFFGRNDPETFWMVDENFKPRPAYLALVECSKQLKNARTIGSTGFGELIQRHYFRRADGSTLLAAWALKDGVKPDFTLPPGAKIVDELGKPVSGELTLGHGVHYITGIDVPEFIAKEVLASALDKSNFSFPSHRFTVKPGASFSVPLVVFNGGNTAVRAAGTVLSTNPGWTIAVPPPLDVAGGATGTAAFDITVPATAVPGVEYEFTFAARLDGLRRTQPYTVRVKTEGVFPYAALKRNVFSGDYPMWNPMAEHKVGTGNPELTAQYGTAAVDGDLGDWKDAKFFPIDQKFQWILRDPGQPGDLDWSGQVAFRWDEKNLYAAFLVEDDELCFSDFLSRDWRDSDNMRLFLSSEADAGKRSKKISEKDLLLIMTPTGITRTEGPMVSAASLGGFVRKDAATQVKAAARMWKNGYVLEVAVPFSLFQAKPEAGAVLGLNVMADDVDGGFRQHAAMTCYRSVDYWNSPKSLGNLRLVR